QAAPAASTGWSRVTCRFDPLVGFRAEVAPGGAGSGTSALRCGTSAEGAGGCAAMRVHAVRRRGTGLQCTDRIESGRAPEPGNSPVHDVRRHHMGWTTGLEPATTATTTRCSTN